MPRREVEPGIGSPRLVTTRSKSPHPSRERSACTRTVRCQCRRSRPPESLEIADCGTATWKSWRVMRVPRLRIRRIWLSPLPPYVLPMNQLPGYPDPSCPACRPPLRRKPRRPSRNGQDGAHGVRLEPHSMRPGISGLGTRGSHWRRPVPRSAHIRSRPPNTQGGT